MAKKQPNSVLFSLEELRRIEEQRVADEERKKQDAIDSAVRAKQETARRIQEEQALEQQQEQERLRLEREAQEAAEREERLRLAEAERRARIDAEMKLQQHRIAMEAEASAKVGAHKLRNTILVIVSGAMILVAGLGYFLYQKSQEKAKAERERQASLQQIEDLKREAVAQAARFKAEQEGLEGKMDALNEKLSSAKTDARRELLRKQRKALRQQHADLAKKRARAAAAARRRAKVLKVGGDDPLGGLKL